MGLGHWAARASRSAGRDGAVIGGRVALAVDPRCVRRLAAGRRVVLVSGTNGKTTTTALLTAALGRGCQVATNGTGANMPDGLAAALIAGRQAPYAALEVDEGYLPEMAEAAAPEAIVLLNLSRDQLDRVTEMGKLEARLRAALHRATDTVVVADADDALVVSAASAAVHRIWVALGGNWTQDAAACPRCGQRIHRDGDAWECRCGLRRPEPDWTLDGDRLTAPDGSVTRLPVRLPGLMNRRNAAMAVVAATTIGVPAAAAARRVCEVADVSGRYKTVDVRGRSVRLLLAKNPAGWTETLSVLDPASRLVIAVDAQQSDGRDPSWLWDVPFEMLGGREVLVTGGRAADLAVRLLYAGVRQRVLPDMWQAIEAAPAGPVDVVATYSCFHRLWRAVEHAV